MFKFLILSTVLSVAASQEVEWFKGKWLQAVGYPNITIPTPMCDWKEFSLPLSTQCVCGNRTVPLVAMVHLHRNDARAFAVMMFEGMDGLKQTLEQKCECYNGIEEYPLVFRKINENYMVLYGRYKNVFSRQTEPNLAYLLVRNVPKLSELTKVMAGIDDLRNRDHSFNCDSKYFADERDD